MATGAPLTVQRDHHASFIWRRCGGQLVAGVIIATLLAAQSGLAVASTAGVSRGPRTRVDPYLLPIDAAKVQTKSLLTVGDRPAGGSHPYGMVGLPDGLGAFADRSGRVTMVSNHELMSTQGVVHATGMKGAFVSRFTLDPSTGDVTDGGDLITSAADVDFSGTPVRPFSRFCSGDLAGSASLYNAATGNGYDGLLYFAGEEAGSAGRLVAHDPMGGEAKVIPAAGFTSWENFVGANTSGSDRVVFIGNNDTVNQANFVYVGTKAHTGTRFEKAGLTNGAIFGTAVAGTRTEATFRSKFGRNNPQPFRLTTALSGITGAAQQADAIVQGALRLDRTEDGAWDPTHPNDFYFVTTGSSNPTPKHGRGGLWRQRFKDRTNPALGGTLTLLLDGSESRPLYMPDNITIDGAGHILILEDPGKDDYVARVFAFDIPTSRVAPIATFDPARFGIGGSAFITSNEEASGIIPAPVSFGPNRFLLDAQAHSAKGLPDPTAQVERGQYILMSVNFARVFARAPSSQKLPTASLLMILPLGATGVLVIAQAFRGRRSRLGGVPSTRIGNRTSWPRRAKA